MNYVRRGFESLQLHNYRKKIMIIKKVNITGHNANTLPKECIGKNESGWEISGEIHEDYYEWVNDFEATHPTFGKM